MSQAPASSLDAHPGYAVKRVQLAVRVAMDAVLADSKLSMAQFAALRVLADAGPLPGAELARRCFITRQSMRDVLKSLVERGFVEEITAREGGRVRSLSLAPDGRDAMEKSAGQVAAVNARMVRGLTARQQAELVSLLNRCADNLKAGLGS